MSTKIVNSAVFQAGDWYLISGITGRKGEELIPGGFEAEFKRILERLKELLVRNDLKLIDVAKMNIYLKDMSNRERLNELYLEFFDGHLPARTVVGANEISRGGEVELEGWAYKKR